MPGALIGRDSSDVRAPGAVTRPNGGTVGPVRVTRHRYAVDGWGIGEVVVADGTVLLHELPGCVRATGTDDPPSSVDGPPPPRGDASPPEVTLAEDLSRVCADFEPRLDESAVVATELARRVGEHLAGRVTGYDDLPLDLSWCTAFQAELAQAIRAVPWGEIVSYGELAALAGRPGAARAAGSFCAGNRFALIFPCHRVVSADGIGGYGDSGPALKRRLLALEGIEL